MSLIHRQYKYNNSFKATDTILTLSSLQKKDTSQVTLKTDPGLVRSPSKLLPSQPFKDPKFEQYFGSIETTRPRCSLFHRSSPISGMLPATEISIADLYQSNNGKETPSALPIISGKKNKVPNLQLRQLYTLEPENTPLPSSNRYEISPRNAQSTRRLKPLENKNLKLGAYLEYLTLNSPREEKLNQKLRAPAELRNPKLFKGSSQFESSALEMNAQLIASNLPLTSKASDSNSANNGKDRKDSLKQRPSKMFADLAETHTLTLDSKTPSKADLVSHTKKAQPTYIRKASFLFNPRKRRQSQNTPEIRDIFKDIAVNLHEVFLHHPNEKQLSKIVETLAEGDEDVLRLVLSKYHKISDYDPVRLEQKLSTIEFLYENISVPLKLQKKKEGKTLLEPSFFLVLQVFAQKLEDYNVKRRYENLEAVNYTLKETKQKIRVFQEKKGTQLAKEGKILDFMANREKTKNIEKILQISQPGLDPAWIVDDIQRNYLNYKHLKKKNLDFARCVNDIYNEWVK